MLTGEKKGGFKSRSQPVSQSHASTPLTQFESRSAQFFRLVSVQQNAHNFSHLQPLRRWTSIPHGLVCFRRGIGKANGRRVEAIQLAISLLNLGQDGFQTCCHCHQRQFYEQRARGKGKQRHSIHLHAGTILLCSSSCQKNSSMLGSFRSRKVFSLDGCDAATPIPAGRLLVSPSKTYIYSIQLLRPRSPAAYLTNTQTLIFNYTFIPSGFPSSSISPQH